MRKTNLKLISDYYYDSQLNESKLKDKIKSPEMKEKVRKVYSESVSLYQKAVKSHNFRRLAKSLQKGFPFFR